jgi:probable rRNA maturation factor
MAEALMTEKSTEELTRSELPHQVDVQWAVQAESWMPDNADICRWACEVLRNLGGDGQPAEVCVRIVSESEIKGLNRDYRDVNKVTNVLAFPQSIELDVGANLLGDIVICAPVVVSEAQTQVKEPRAHFAHLIIHGMLHLLGYDHVENEEAEEMERIEISILRGLGVDDPYQQ